MEYPRVKITYKCPGCGEKKVVDCIVGKWADAVCITCETVQKVKIDAPVKMWEPSH